MKLRTLSTMFLVTISLTSLLVPVGSAQRPIAVEEPGQAEGAAPEVLLEVEPAIEDGYSGLAGGDQRLGPDYVDATGGPDLFGYTFKDSTEPDGPIADWAEITGTNNIPFGDDTWHGPYPIGFTFNYYGVDYTDFWAGSNGWLSLGGVDPGDAAFNNDCPLPNPLGIQNYIAAIHDDLSQDTAEPHGTGWYASYPAGSCPYYPHPGACLVVEWSGMYHWYSDPPDNLTFEVILFDNNDFAIVVFEAGDEAGSGSTTGIENADASDGLTYACYTPDSLTDLMAIQFYYPRPGVTIGPDRSNSACAPSPVEYSLIVWNGGTLADTVDIYGLASNAWPYTLEPVQLTLGAGMSGTVSVTVQIPSDAEAGAMQTLTVTAAAQTSGVQDDSVIETTAALASGWEDLAPSPHGARFLAVVYDDGHLYQIGGNDDGGYHDGTYAYDIAANTWMTMTSMITAAYNMDGAAIDGTIYIPGGETSAAARSASVQAYSTSADTWSPVEPMPVPLRYHEVVAHDGLLYVLGGEIMDDLYSADVLIYDPATDSWTAGTPMPTAVGHAASGVIGGKIYLAGGYNGSAYQTALQIYDPASDTWASGADLPEAWAQAADGVKHDRYLILAGGYGGLTTASIYALVYDAVNDTWTFLPHTNSLRYGAEGDGDGSEFYYIAGRESADSWIYSKRNEHLIQCAAPTPDEFFIYLPIVIRDD
jgi:N-acetylneuraminic acid mutarotase